MEPLYNGHLWGTIFNGLYTGMAFVERLFCTQTVHLGLGACRYIAAGLYSEVVVNRGSSVYTCAGS